MDPEGIVWMRGLLRSLAAEGRAMLVSSHLMNELQHVVQHLVVLAGGRVLADAPVAELLAAQGPGRIRAGRRSISRLTQDAARSSGLDYDRGAAVNFVRQLRAEWTKFRSVRAWVLAVVGAAVVTAALGPLSLSARRWTSRAACAGPALVRGPDGQAVNDSFYFVRRQLAGDGTITVRVTDLTGITSTGTDRVISKCRVGEGRASHREQKPASSVAVCRRSCSPVLTGFGSRTAIRTTRLVPRSPRRGCV